MMRRFISRMLAGAAVVAMCGAWAESAHPNQDIYVIDLRNIPAMVIDGDTFDAFVRFRLSGVDAPESDQVYQRSDGTFLHAGAEATKALADMLRGGTLECIKAGISYDRIVAYCTVDGKDIAAQLVRRGLAFHDPKYSSGWYKKLLAIREAQARDEQIGIWQVENPERPKPYRDRVKAEKAAARKLPAN